MPKEYIEREVALNKIKKLQKTDPATVGKKQFSEGYFCGLDEAEIVLLQTPTADVAEVKHGKWIKDRNCYTCSECGFYYFANNSKANYCPNCGAEMDKE